MRFVISILILLISLNVFGQEGKLRFTRIDTSCHYNNETKAFLDSFYYDLPDISKSFYKTHIRVGLTGKYVDLFSEDNKNYNGIITNYVIQSLGVKSNNRKVKSKINSDKIIVQKVFLDSVKCSLVAQEVINSGQVQLPSLSGMGMDCGKVEFTFKIDDFYREQNFSCMYFVKESNSEKAIVDSNLKLLSKNLNLETPYNFLSQIKPSKVIYTYRNGGQNVLLVDYRPLFYNRRKSRLFTKKRANKVYLDSISNSLDSFLQLELVMLIPKAQRKEFYDNYILHFSKRNRLQKVTTDFTYFSRDDKKDFRKCRRKLKNVFRIINLDFVHSKFGFDKKLQFDKEGSPQINNEIY